MKSFLTWSLAAAVIVGLASESFARGGRGGGERGFSNGAGERQIGTRTEAGNHEAGKNTNGAAKNNAQNRASEARSNFAAGNRPFSGGWYANHPGAWRFTHPYANAWGIASFAGAATWLGLAGAGGEDTAIATEEVTTADTGDDTSDDTSDDASDETASDEQDSTSDSAAAAQLASTGAQGEGDSANYLPLGVFALAPKNQKEAAALVQIAVSKEGTIRGSYYDLLTDQGHAIQGAVDKKTQRVAFTIGDRGKTVFETQLADLTQPKGEVSLHFTDGQATDWTLSRYDADPSTGVQK